MPKRPRRDRSRSAEAWRAASGNGAFIAEGSFSRVTAPPGAPATSRTIIRRHVGPLSKKRDFLQASQNALLEKELGEEGVLPRTELLNARYDPKRRRGAVVQQIERFATDLQNLDEKALTDSQIEAVARTALQSIARFAELTRVNFDVKPSNMGVFLGGAQGYRCVMHDIDRQFMAPLPPRMLKAIVKDLCSSNAGDVAERAVVCAVMLGLLILTLAELAPDKGRLLSCFRRLARNLNFPMSRLLEASYAVEPGSAFWSEFERVYAKHYLDTPSTAAAVSMLADVFRGDDARKAPWGSPRHLLKIAAAFFEPAAPPSEKLAPACCETSCPPAVGGVLFRRKSPSGPMLEAKKAAAETLPGEVVMRRLKQERAHTPPGGRVSDHRSRRRV